MSAATLPRRIRDWTDRHPWPAMLVSFVLLTIVFWLLPPDNGLGPTALKVGIAMLLVLGLNFLRYRSFFPTKQQIRDDEAKASEIAAAVKRGRDSVR